MHAQDGRLWGVNDGRAKQGAKHATVADGESASVHILDSELVFTSLRNKTQRIYSFIQGCTTTSRNNKYLKDCFSQ